MNRVRTLILCAVAPAVLCLTAGVAAPSTTAAPPSRAAAVVAAANARTTARTPDAQSRPQSGKIGKPLSLNWTVYVGTDEKHATGTVTVYSGGHAAVRWSVWRSSRCRKLSRSVVVNFHLNAVAVWL